MRIFRNFARRCSHPPARSPFHRETENSNRTAALILIALLCCLSSGCARRVTYVNSDHKLTRVEAGQPAPQTGVLISEGYLAEIFEALGKEKK
jgi:hypothetical protein